MKERFYWKHKGPVKLYHNLVKLLGKANAISYQKHGMAIWARSKKKIYGQRNIFEEHILRDESVKHNCPREHRDYFYSYIKVSVKPEQLPALLSLSGSVGYDPLKKLIYARCAGIGANIVSLKMALDILLNHKVKVEIDDKVYEYKGIKEIQKLDIYGKTISATKDKEFAKDIYKQLVRNLTKYNRKHKVKETGYWEGAFSYSVKKCYPPSKKNRICKK